MTETPDATSSDTAPSSKGFSKAEIAQLLGISPEDVDKRVVEMTPEIEQQLAEGKLSILPGPMKQAAPVAGEEPAPIDPATPLPKPIGQAPAPAEGPGAHYGEIPSPRQLIEQNFLRKLNGAAEMGRGNIPVTGNVPKQRTPEEVAKAMSKENEGKPAVSVYTVDSDRLRMSGGQLRKVLGVRPPGSPSILEECKVPIKLSVSQHQSPGDILMLTAAIRDLHAAYPGMFITNARTPCTELWYHNPDITPLTDNDPEVQWISCAYPLVNTSNTGPHHFIHGFRKDLEDKLGLPIPAGEFKGVVHFTPDEKKWMSQVREILEKDVPYWIIDAGCKNDYTAKQWEIARFQEVVDALPEIQFVQIGAGEKTGGKDHFHEELTGDNVLNLLNKTSIRQFMRLMYHAAGVITPVSFPMHLAAAVEMHPRFRRRHRPCITICGGREPSTWEAYSNHQFLHTCGMLPCCEIGGCWKSRVKPLGDDDLKDFYNTCERPVVSKSGQIVPKCMDMITVDMVVDRVRMYMEAYDFSGDSDHTWHPQDHDTPEEVAKLQEEAEARIPRSAWEEREADWKKVHGDSAEGKRPDHWAKTWAKDDIKVKAEARKAAQKAQQDAIDKNNAARLAASSSQSSDSAPARKRRKASKAVKPQPVVATAAPAAPVAKRKRSKK